MFARRLIIVLGTLLIVVFVIDSAVTIKDCWARNGTVVKSLARFACV